MWSKPEEKWNTITHAVALGMAATAATLSISTAGVILSVALAVTYAMSVLYHSAERLCTRETFRMLDMASIHATIGATGYAYCSTAGSDLSALCILFSVFGLIYTIKHFGTEKLDTLMVPICVATGLSCLGLYMLSPAANSTLTWFFLLGTLFYIAGLAFYVYDNNRWYHTVWHLFVTAAAFIHIQPFL